MLKKTTLKDAFTLIEVMIAVMIISVVIMALLQIYANSTHIFFSLKSQTKSNQYSSFLLANENYGFEDKNNITLYDLVSDFDVEDELRRELKGKKVKLIYTQLETIDLSESEVQEEETSSENLGVVLEVGRDTLQLENISSSVLRFRLQ